MEFWGITAFGLPDNYATLIDSTMMTRPQAGMGAGVRARKLLVAPVVLGSRSYADVPQLTMTS